jgi:hypothetical protein
MKTIGITSALSALAVIIRKRLGKTTTHPHANHAVLFAPGHPHNHVKVNSNCCDTFPDCGCWRIG